MGDVAQNMIGFRSGRLRVIARSAGPDPKRAYWLCCCDCGGEVTAMGKYLRKGEVKSCGCLNRQGIAGPSNFRHGHAPESGVSKTYRIWAGMIQRCENTANGAFAEYGAKGIKVCERWHEFPIFLADMGECPEGRSIDRFPDMVGNYEPGNCRWATPKEQANNTRRNRRITFNGETLTLTEWGNRLNIPLPTLHSRLKRLPIEQALRPNV